jgi:hypothetical protein
MNFEKYKCSDCGLSGVKLWRDYGYCDELWCAVCCEKRIAKAEEKHPPSPWDDPPGPLNMMRYGFNGVAAIPCDDDCDLFQSSGALKSEQLLAWHALPTFVDENREIRTVMHMMREAWDDLGNEYKWTNNVLDEVNKLRKQFGRLPLPTPPDPTKDGYGWEHKIDVARAVMLSHLEKLYAEQKRRMDLYEEKSNLEWHATRRTYVAKKSFSVKIYGSETIKSGDWYITGPKEMDKEVYPGMEIAVGRTGSAVLILGETYKECPSILDFDGDGYELINSLRGRGLIA